MPHKILTISGSDTISGGGLQADLATFSEYGYFGLSAVTSIATVTPDDFCIHPLPADLVSEQLDSVLSLDDIVAIKVGLLPTREIVHVVASHLKRVSGIPIIVDPVMVFKETNDQDTQDIARVLIKEFLPLATLITPNLQEAQIMSHMTITSVSDMKLAAKRLFDLGVPYVVVKGGNRISGDKAIDVLYDGETYHIFEQEKILTELPFNNGAGCTLSASLAVNVSQKQQSIKDCMLDAKEFVWYAIKEGVLLNKQFVVGDVWQGARKYQK